VIYIFLFIAVPEELFFRAWVQNLLERRVGRRTALVITAVLFGLSHFNKRSAHFNWRYVVLASVAGFSTDGPGASNGECQPRPSPTRA